MVPVSRGVAYSILAGLTAALVVVGCSRDLAVPTSVFVPGTPTVTGTSTSSPTATSTKTATQTPTSTNTGLPSATATSSNTSTDSPTMTDTLTQTDTPTQTNTVPPGSTNTDTATSTFSATATSTSSATATVTPTPTFASCSASSVQNTNFDSAIGCWAIDGGSTAVVSGYDISGAHTHAGSGALRIGVSEPSSAPAPIQINLNYVPPANLTGATITAWVLVDNVSLIGGSTGAALFTQSGGPGWTYANGGFPNITTANTWVQVTWTPTFSNPGEDSTQVDQIGLQIYGVPANAVGNIYIDDINITYANTPTMTSTPTVTNTVGGFTSTPTTTPTVTVTSTPGGPCTIMLNDCENLTDNGYWSNQNGTVFLTATNHTQGSYGLDCNITTGNSYNKFAVLNAFAPSDLTNATAIILDVNVDSALVTGNGGYDQMQLQANNGGKTLNANSPALVAGAQSVTINLQNTSSGITDLEFVYQSNATPIGHIYIDNVRAVFTAGSCPSIPVTTYTLLDDFSSSADGWAADTTNIAGTVAPTSSGWSSTDGSVPGCFASLYSPTALADGTVAGIYKTLGTTQDWSAYSGICYDVKLDNNGGYPGTKCFVASGGDTLPGPCMNGCWVQYPINPPVGFWVRMNYTLAGLTDVTTVKQLELGVQANGGAISGNFSIDNVELY